MTEVTDLFFEEIVGVYFVKEFSGRVSFVPNQ